MGFYRERVLPLLVDWSLDSEPIREQRRAALAGLSGTVVEVGFGTGLNLSCYPPGVTRVIAVEPSAGMHRRAQRHVAGSPIAVEYIGFDAEGHYPLAEGTVDAVVTTFTLCTIPEPARALVEFRRLLRPGAEYRFLEHGASPDPAVLRWQNRLNPIQRVVGGGCNLNRPVADLVRGAGFARVELEQYRMPKTPRVAAEFYRGVAVR